MAAKIFEGYKNVKFTIGSDFDTGMVIESMGATHVDCQVRDIVVDTENKVVSTPAYMLAQSISEAADGIEALIHKLLELA